MVDKNKRNGFMKNIIVFFMFGTCLMNLVATEKVVINLGDILPWDSPLTQYENWRFFPLEWQKEAVSEKDLINFQLNTTIKIEDYIFRETVFDTAQYMRYMSMAQFYFQGGLIFRYLDSGNFYRLQFSVKDQTVALWRTPGNFLAAVDCDIKQGKAFNVKLRAIGSRIMVSVNGKDLIDVVDRFDPILKGKVFAGSNHSKISFENTEIDQPSDRSMPSYKHTVNFSIKEWCGYRWIFDGDEPIARIGEGKNGKAWSWHPLALYSAKFRPGTRAADSIMLQYHSKENWPEKPLEIIDSGPKKIKIRVFGSDRREDKEPSTDSVCDTVITYDPVTDAYIYNMSLTRKYLMTRTPIGEILDPWPYGVSGPAYPQAKQWDYRYKYVLWQGEDSKYYHYPLNHFLGPVENKLNPQKSIFIFAGEKYVNPTYEIIASTYGRDYKIGLCTAMLDMHVQSLKRPKLIHAGTEEEAKWRITSTHGAELEEIKQSAGWHESWNKQLKQPVALFDPAGSTFSPDQTVTAVTPNPAHGFYPGAYYIMDKEVGRKDSFSLRMDPANGSRLIRIEDGLSPFGRAFDGREMKLKLYVKTENLDGSFKVDIIKPEKISSKEFKGTSDGWKLVELNITPKPSDPNVMIHFVFDSNKNNTGKVWIDDVSFLPVRKCFLSAVRK